MLATFAADSPKFPQSIVGCFQWCHSSKSARPFYPVVMPAVSKAQQAAMAIAEHAPEKLSKKNSGLLQMSKPKLREFARTKTSGLPRKAKM